MTFDDGNPPARRKDSDHYATIFKDGVTRSWSVFDTLIPATANLPVQEIDLDTFSPEMREKPWGDEMTLSQFYAHLRRVMKADLQYPIILSPEGWIMDGCHRLLKAKFEGHKTIKVVRLISYPPCDIID